MDKRKFIRICCAFWIISMFLFVFYSNSVYIYAANSSDAEDAFEVNEDTYNNAYRDDPDYVVLDTLTYYQYASRQKLDARSGYDSMDGWTKYDSKSSTSVSGYKFGTPISSSTSYANNQKTETSATNAGYYYYGYSVANPSRTSDWTYYVDKSRSAVISHMKANFSSSATWAESRLRYFWYISSSDLGAISGKLNFSTPYCEDSTVSTGTTSQSGIHLYDLKMYKYNRCYKVKTVTTTNYFYKWTAWSAWSPWSTERESVPSDGTVKENTETRYVLQREKSATPLSECTLSVDGKTEFPYDGNEKSITVQIEDQDQILVEGKDYVLEGNLGVDAGKYPVKAIGIGDYSGELNTQFSILKVSPSFKFKTNEVRKSEKDGDFINELQCDSDGTLDFNSSNENVATVGSDGTVSIVGRGTTTIHVKSTEGVNYTAGSADYFLSVNIPFDKCTITFEGSDHFTYDGDVKKLVLRVKDDGRILTEGKDYIIDGNEGVDAGRYIVTIEGIGDYLGQKDHVMTIEKAVPQLMFKSDNVTRKLADSSYSNPIESESNGEITYTVSDGDIATIDDNGNLSLKCAGTVTITASQSATTNYKATIATYVLSIIDKQRALDLEDLTYNFANSRTAYGYGDTYTIPEQAYSTIFGSFMGDIIYANLTPEQKKWGGNCAGVASSAALLFEDTNGINVNTFNKEALYNRDLKLTDQNSEPFTLLEFIEALQIGQRCSYFMEADERNRVTNVQLVDRNKSLNRIVSMVKEQTETGIPILVSIRHNEDGHALLGYKFEDSGDRGKLYVYDSNYPRKVCYIPIEKDKSGKWMKWSYDMGTRHGVWGSQNDNLGDCISLVPMSVIQKIWDERGHKLNALKDTTINPVNVCSDQTVSNYTYTLKYTDEVSSQASCDAKIAPQTMKCAAFVPTTTKKFTRAYYSYNNWYIKKYFNNVAYYWCRDIATGQKGTWIKWSSFASQKYGRSNTYNGYRKMELKHGGSLYFGDAQRGQTIYLTPAWTRNTFTIAYVDGISSTVDDSNVIPSHIAYCGEFNPTSTQKFTRPGYHYNTRFIKKYENGDAYYWCREKSTRANPKWIRYDQIPNTYYKENGAVGNTVWFNDEIKGRTIYITPEWIKDDNGLAVESDEESYDVYLDEDINYGLDESEDSTIQVLYDPSAYASMSSRITSLKTVQLSKPKAGKKSFKLAWKSIKGANKYRVAYKLNKAKKWKYKVCKNNKLKIKNLKKHKKYMVKVRAMRQMDRTTVMGSWSKVKKVKVK